MTGIERLREFTEARPSLLTCDQIEELRDISAQIAREHAEDCHRMGLDYGTVLSVAADMERHFPCVERGEESDVERWSRELRGALGGRAQGHAADVSMSAYDLLPEEDREALRWVREHGGIGHVRDQWSFLRGRANHADHVDRQLARRQRQIDESHAALRRRNDMLARYSEANKALLERAAAMKRRLMPEGCEWLRYDTGEPVPLGGEVTVTVHDEDGDFDRTLAIRSIKYKESGVLLEGTKNEMVILSYGERVRRPAPKVYDADGAEIREGDRVWSTRLDEPHEWTVIDPHEDRDNSQTVLVSIGDRTGHARPEDLTHRAPVLAADGKPLKEGQTVWSVNDGREYKVITVESPVQFDTTSIKVDDGKAACGVWIRPDNLTHQRPVLDADGEPIHEGDTVYLLPGEWCDELPCLGFHGGEELEVFADGEASHVPGSVQCREKEKTLGRYGTCYPQPSQLTHTKPEPPDSWERVEEDIAEGFMATEETARDLREEARDIVRRARALAERGA